MNAKYYPLKFGLVGIVVAVCIWSLYARRLNWGIDIRGGHTLQYEIQRREDDPHDLVQKAIVVLKRRVDPQGLAGLQWQPAGGNRFEVRMPTSGPESQQRKNAYDLAMEELQRSNIQRSEIRRVEQLSPGEREKEIRKLSGADERLEKLVSELVRAYGVTLERENTFQQKKAELERARKKSAGTNLERLEKELEEAQDARDLASLEYRKKYGAVLDTNIRQGELEAILENFVSLTEEKALRKVGKSKEIDRRREMYKAKLQELREAHPTRVAEIDKVVERYEGWARGRRPLGDPSDLRF